MTAAVFPGQGSQKPGMGKALYDAFSEAREVFEAVRSATGVPIQDVCFHSDEETLRQTQNAQLALYTCGMAAFRSYSSRAGLELGAAAGHSVGEYAALAAAGAVSLQDGARLVQRRGDLMSRVGNLRPGAMAAVLGLERDVLEEVCRQASSDSEAVVIANDNSPGQLVISGDRAAVERASAEATAKGARRVLPLNVSGAFHSPLMEAPAQEMALALRDVEFGAGNMPVYANVTSEKSDETNWVDLLERQLKSPVRWTESVRNMRRDGVEAFIEFGSGEVLCGLIRRIDPEARAFAVQDPDSLQAALEALGQSRVGA
jgi:[acyl-carrier-protein] S-malonyltransferase